MSRFIRLYEKKRGERRTGSKAVGDFGEALFFCTFFVVGCIAFVAMFSLFVWPEWRANRQFAAAQCIVLSKAEGKLPATVSEPARYRPEILIRYTVDDRDYEESTYDVTGIYLPDQAAVQRILDEFDVEGVYPCWYDPMDPHRVVLVRGYSGWLYLTLLIPFSFMTIGGGALAYTLVHWNASAERRALLVQRAAQLDLFEVDDPQRDYPTVPVDTNLTNSPGTHLAFRLPLDATTGRTLWALAAACILWNGIVLFFAVYAVRSYARGGGVWLWLAFVVPFAVAGIALVVYSVRQAMIANGIGPTRIEISRHPLSPGQDYDVFLSQTGRLSMRSLSLWLACDERASFRQGTDTRTETRRVYEDRCFLREGFEVQPGIPFECRCRVRVPEEAMHSFQADHNEIAWKLIVKGSVAGWPDYERAFQIVVNPKSNGRREP